MRHILSSLTFLLFCLQGFGQYGPMGIGNSTGADGQPELLLWLDADDVIYNGSNIVTSWPDRSGNEQHFTSAPGSNITYSASGGPHGRPYLTFDGGINSYLINENFDFSQDEFTIFFVVQTSDSRYGIFSYASGSEPQELLISNNSGIKMRMRGTERSSSIGNFDNTWHYGGILWKNSDNAIWEYNRTNHYEPSSSNPSLGNGFSVSTNGTALIGNIQTIVGGGLSADSAFTGKVAEIFVYGGKLNKAMGRLMRTYLKVKFGFTQAGGNWDKMYNGGVAVYQEDVIGIGRDAGSDTEHILSRAAGLVLKANNGGLNGSYPYLCAAHNGVPNGITASEVGFGMERWERIWYLNQITNADVQIGFDFGDGIEGGLYPLNAENYVLLRRSGTSGTFSIVPVTSKTIIDQQISFRIDGNLNSGFYTVGTLDPTNSSLNGQEQRSWFSYQSGYWNDPNTWTLDGSAAPYLINPEGEIPGSGDIVTINSGRTVTVNVNNLSLSSLKCFGTLDLVQTTGQEFGSISGNGKIRLAGNSGVDNFPGGTTTDFADPLTGGTVEYYGSGFSLENSVALTLNDVVVNLDNGGSTIVVRGNQIFNGDFTIEKGTWQINGTENISRNLTSHGDVHVAPTGRILVSTFDKKHTWNFYGDLINQGGVVKFTNRTGLTAFNLDNIPTEGWIDANFISEDENQELTCNGTSNFARIGINKGDDATYILRITADADAHFNLWGYANGDMGAGANIANPNSLGLYSGTVEIGEHVFIPLHVHSGNYNINEKASLWVNGGTVTKGNGLPGASNSQAIVVYGSIKVSAGTLNANCKSGITSRGTGMVKVEGTGTLNANQFRTSNFGPENIGGLDISGGTVKIDGTRPGNVEPDFYTFSLSYPGNVFKMSGNGVLIVAGPSDRGLFFVNSDPQNISITGGVITLDIKSGTDNHRISTRAHFYNLTLKKSGTGANKFYLRGGTTDNSPNGATIDDYQTLIVKNDLTILDNVTLKTINTSVPEGLDVYIGGDLTMSNFAVYDKGTNTTYFDGNGNSDLNLGTNNKEFYNVIVNKNHPDRLVSVQSGAAQEAMRINGDLRVENGTMQLNRSISVEKNVFVKTLIGNISGSEFLRMTGTGDQIITSENGTIYRLLFNKPDGNVFLDGTNLTIGKELYFTSNTYFNLGSQKLRMDGNNWLITGANNTNKYITTNGSASAGGLEIFVNNNENFNLPIGVYNSLSNTAKYTPVVLHVKNYSDDGYIRIIPIDDYLYTVNLDFSTDSILSFYWKIDHSDFEELPNVCYLFRYDDEDLEGFPENGNVFVPGKVLDELPFTRSNEENGNIHFGNNWIYFNNSSGQNYNGDFLLEKANYTAGAPIKFTGLPKVFFSNNASEGIDWETAANWNNFNTQQTDAVAAHNAAYTNFNGSAPTPGSVVYIGFDDNSGQPHFYFAPESPSVAEVRFTKMVDGDGDPVTNWGGGSNGLLYRPTLDLSLVQDIGLIKKVSGEGTLLFREFGSDADLSGADLGDFLAEDSSIVFYQAFGTLPLNHIPENLPNLFVEGGKITFSENINVRGNVMLIGKGDIVLSGSANGDLSIGGNLIMDPKNIPAPSPQLLFPNNGNSREVTVFGDLILKGPDAGVFIQIPSNNSSQTGHTLNLKRNIIQNTSGASGLDFYISDTEDYITLNLTGDGNHHFSNIAGPAPELWRLIMDKGLNTTSSFTFTSDLLLSGPTNLPEKALDLRTGLLIFDHADIDLTLSNGGGDFRIPENTGVQLKAGSLFINGTGTGLLLSGKLNIQGGVFEIGNTPGEDNYLEYSVANSELNVSGGMLKVGSQLRRGLTSEDGTLNYIQSGGEVIVGINSAPATNRGVFEIVGDGSFVHTGGTLTLVRGVNSSVKPSLLLDITNFNVDGSEIIIGNINTPAGPESQNIGIQSRIPLNKLTINGHSNPLVKLYSYPLTIRGAFEISSGATFNSNGRDLTIKGDLINDGSLLATDAHLKIDNPTSNNIGGSGVFEIDYLDKTGSGNSHFNSNLSVNKDLFVNTTSNIFGGNKIEVKGNARIDGTLEFTSGEGLVFNGLSEQELDRSSSAGQTNIDILTIDNPMGVKLINSGRVFKINKEVRLQRGILNLNGNLMELGTSSVFTAVNPYGYNNMINTGGAFTNFGVRKSFPVSTQENFYFPIGLDKFMPVELVFYSEDDPLYSSGDLESGYLVRLTGVLHSIVAAYPDSALNMYYSVNVDQIGDNYKGDIIFNYDDDPYIINDIDQNPEFIPVKVLSADNSIAKYSSDFIDPDLNTLKFEFNAVNQDAVSGDYFAAIDNVIPEDIKTYETNQSGFVGDEVYTPGVVGGGAPSGAIVNINTGHTLRFNQNSINFYKTFIDDGAVLQIESGTAGHRLGEVTGTGTLRIVGDGVGVSIPAGNYNQFFSASGGILEFTGSGNYDILGGVASVKELLLTGSGSRLMANNDFVVIEDFTVTGPDFINSNNRKITIENDLLLSNGTFNIKNGELLIENNADISGGKLTSTGLGIRTINGNIEQSAGQFSLDEGGLVNLKGNYNHNGGTFNAGVLSSSLFSFNGENGTQTINGNLTGVNGFYRIEIDNPDSLNLNGNISVAKDLLLTNGIINTDVNNTLLFTNSGTKAIPAKGSEISFINGPMDWSLPVVSSTAHYFPVGKNERWRYMGISQTSAARTWTVEYFDTTAYTLAPAITGMEPTNPVEVDNISKQEYWKVNSNTAQSTDARLLLSWGLNSAVSEFEINQDELMVVAYNDGLGTWDHFGGQNYETGEVGQLESANLLSFTERIVTLGSGDQITNPLPVTFLTFTGETSAEKNVLSWSTATEINNDYFVIERSEDGVSFKEIARVEGAGNSNTLKLYQVSDQEPPLGTLYYRLKQVDFDGQYEYADNMVVLTRQSKLDEVFDFVIYPNPAISGDAEILLLNPSMETALLMVYDLTGKLEYSEQLSLRKGENNFILDKSLKPGAYIVQIIKGDTKASKKLIIFE